MNKCFMVAGLAYGDCSKGATVDALTRKYNASLIVRYNGGHNAAHNVVLPDGKHHTFAQFGSGTFVPGVHTYLSKYMMVNPVAMLKEEEALQKVGVTDGFQRLSIDSRCLVVTPFDRILNVLRESKTKHGSCGVGIGETRLYNNRYGTDSLVIGDLRHEATCAVKLMLRQQRACEAAQEIGCRNNVLEYNGVVNDIVDGYKAWLGKSPKIVDTIDISNHQTIIFEGAQGVLLDERAEFLPHNTWSKTTLENADALLDEWKYKGERVRIGCIRSYMTRHGAGPLFTEDYRFDVLPEPHNTDRCFQGKFRRGHFDLGAVTHSLELVGGVDEIHMSHLDCMPHFFHNIDDAGIELYLYNLERLLKTPITVTSYGPTWQDRRERERRFVARRRGIKVGTRLSLSPAEQATNG